MSDINPIDDAYLYNVISLGGLDSPGIVTITGHDRVQGWDIKSGSGQKGATMTRKKSDPIEFTCSFKLADREDFDAWPSFAAAIKATVDGKTPKAVDIYHPDLAEVGITSVVMGTIAGTVHDGLGGQTKVVKFREYLPPAPAPGSPKGSKSSAKAPDPNQAALDELAKLTAQYAQTPWGRPA